MKKENEMVYQIQKIQEENIGLEQKLRVKIYAAGEEGESSRYGRGAFFFEEGSSRKESCSAQHICPGDRKEDSGRM